MSDWACSKCTFENPPTAPRCEMCDFAKKKTTTSSSKPKRQSIGSYFPNTTIDGSKLSIEPKKKRKKAAPASVSSVPKPKKKPKATATKPKPKKPSPEPLPPPPTTTQNIQHSTQTQHHPFFASKYNPNTAKSLIPSTLETTFKITGGLQNLQPIAVNTALERKSQLIVMRTGGGKSLCYQLPAVVFPKLSASNQALTVVVSPLISLMLDQVLKLQSLRISADYIASSKTAAENDATIQNISDLHLVYVTPELLAGEKFRKVLKALHKESKLAMFALDEIHCLSSWGHDFRPAYVKLGWLRDQFPTVPTMACTATATPKVIKDIKRVLKFGPDVPVHRSTFNRSNISYEVRYKDDLVDFIKDEHSKPNKGSGVIYVHKRKDTTFIANTITKYCGIESLPYHAGLKNDVRAATQQKWMSGEVKIAVATVAFGMGIDLDCVRYVVHWNIAKTVEGFYQESGRAGRDGHPSRSILYYAKKDASAFAWLINKTMKADKKKDPSAPNNKLEALENMIEYCVGDLPKKCRRAYLLNHFGEQISKSACGKTCDYCRDPEGTESSMRAALATRSSGGTFTKMSAPKGTPGERILADDGLAPVGDYDGLSDTSFDAFDEREASFNYNDNDGPQIYGGFDDLLSDDEGEGKPQRPAITCEQIFAKYGLEERASKWQNRRGKGGKKHINNYSSSSTSTVVLPDSLKAKLPLAESLSFKKTNTFETNKTTRSTSEIQDEMAKLQRQIAAAKETKASSKTTTTTKAKTSLPLPPPSPPPF
ncbi:hypothetical protein TrVE_jg9016 [Triparma verrucosa]|uniref:ATP-dependent DNA helicase n=1 Tax=Triparma verrucosa TaxID=1606542 RepID=A0A9W7FMS0_9STRA|nr:hypothetical protein TrVE_jg9016 [Triparma verrucosa]